MARHKHNKICRLCGEPFKGWWNQKTCPVCLREMRIKREMRFKPEPSAQRLKPKIATGTTGAIGELKVAVDLMSKGFGVFRALSPNASCDLLVIKDGKQFDIEVRTAYKNPVTGRVHTNRKGVRARYMALVTEKEIVYEPEFF